MIHLDFGGTIFGQAFINLFQRFNSKLFNVTQHCLQLVLLVLQDENLTRNYIWKFFKEDGKGGFVFWLKDAAISFSSTYTKQYPKKIGITD